jgi:hypothetical protein
MSRFGALSLAVLAVLAVLTAKYSESPYSETRAPSLLEKQRTDLFHGEIRYFLWQPFSELSLGTLYSTTGSFHGTQGTIRGVGADRGILKSRITLFLHYNKNQIEPRAMTMQIQLKRSVIKEFVREQRLEELTNRLRSDYVTDDVISEYEKALNDQRVNFALGSLDILMVPRDSEWIGMRIRTVYPPTYAFLHPMPSSAYRSSEVLQKCKSSLKFIDEEVFHDRSAFPLLKNTFVESAHSTFMEGVVKFDSDHLIPFTADISPAGLNLRLGEDYETNGLQEDDLSRIKYRDFSFDGRAAKISWPAKKK